MFRKINLIFMIDNLLFLLFSILNECECDISIYPGLRRKPLQQLQQQQSLSSSNEINNDFLTQLMEGNARRRLQRQFEQQLELINLQIQRQRERQERLRQHYRQHQQQQKLAALVAAENHRRIQEEKAKMAYINNNSNDNESEDDDDDNNDSINNNNSINHFEDGIEENGQEQANNFDTATNFDFDSELNDRIKPDYTYKISRPQRVSLNDPIEFAVGPSDSRFYITTTKIESNKSKETGKRNKTNELINTNYNHNLLYHYDDNRDKNTNYYVNDNDDSENRIKNIDDDSSDIDDVSLENYEEYNPPNSYNSDVKISKVLSIPPLADTLTNEPISSTIRNYHRIKPHQISSSSSASSVVLNDENPDLFNTNTLMENHYQHMNSFAKEPTRIHVKYNMSMYMVALTAGVTAALIMGLFVLSIAWYTFHRRNKAAADIDYPAYGVTGPNKDLSPSLSGDRKLAQNAQIYHYQHQKQQLMAMENHLSKTEETADMSYEESDDDNEEGDYTVYECPGLAPTGEMEVKNPLFLDETPVTSLGCQAITHVTAQQPAMKKSINKNNSNIVKTLTFNTKNHNNRDVMPSVAVSSSETVNSSIKKPKQ